MLIAGTTIAALAGLGILAIGVLYLAIPQAMAANFGLPIVPGQTPRRGYGSRASAISPPESLPSSCS